MGKILCATRGGEKSHRAQDEVIALAKERGDELVFLYVVDLSFLDKTAAPFVVGDVETNLRKMGEFLLAMAQERAREQGVEAKVTLREGSVREGIREAVAEEGATTVVMGRPTGNGCVFVSQALKDFAKELQEEFGVEVLLV